MFDARKLKNGDRVGVYGPYDYQTKILMVQRVSVTGIVTTTDGSRFNVRGQEIGATGSARTMETIEAAEARIAVKTAQRDKNLRLRNFLNAAEEIKNSFRNGYGDFVGELTAEEKAKLIAMIESL